MFAKSGYLVTRWDLEIFNSLDELNSARLGIVFPRAPAFWPTDWGSVPIPLPMDLSVYRHALIAADDDSALWQEMYLLFLEQIAAGWDLEFNEPISNREHLLPQSLAKAILDAGGFFFLPASSKTLQAFRSRHHLNDVAVPVQSAAHHAAWTRIRRAQMAE